MENKEIEKEKEKEKEKEEEEEEEEETCGYDSEEFIEDDRNKAAKFRCTICTCIAREPTETQPCGHLFCKDCLKQYQKSDNGNICPNCRTTIESINVSGFIKRAISELKVRCSNFNYDCDWKGELNSLNDHLLKCSFSLISCEYCKQYEYIKNKANEHWNECNEYPIDCNYCQQKVIRKNISYHIDNICLNTMVNCPNLCSQYNQNNILRKDINIHLKSCELSIVSCPFENVGCTMFAPGQLIRKNLKEHLTDINTWMIHQQLRQSYLKRLIFSTELIRINTTHERSGQISGIYERQWNPHHGRPIYRHRDSEKHASIRFDLPTKRWTLLIHNQIIAERCGLFPTPVFPEQEQEQDQEQDQNQNQNQNQEQEHENKYENSKDQTDLNHLSENKQDVEHKDSSSSNNKNSGGNKNKWQFIDKPEFKIEMIGCAQRDLDLQWNIVQIKAQAQTIQEQLYDEDDEDDEENTDDISGVLCKCGKGLVITTAAEISTSHVIVCDVCENAISRSAQVYHCPIDHHSHPQGYDLCHHCADARRQTQHITKNIVCDCGKVMTASLANRCYSLSSGAACNKCREVVTGNTAIFHCAKNRHHPNGYDICLKCAEPPRKGWFF